MRVFTKSINSKSKAMGWFSKKEEHKEPISNPFAENKSRAREMLKHLGIGFRANNIKISMSLSDLVVYTEKVINDIKRGKVIESTDIDYEKILEELTEKEDNEDETD